jgi:hypothetical protein
MEAEASGVSTDPQPGTVEEEPSALDGALPVVVHWGLGYRLGSWPPNMSVALVVQPVLSNGEAGQWTV